MKRLIVLAIILIQTIVTHGVCNRADRKHVDTNIVRCAYCQEDIYRCYSKKISCYQCCQRRQECFYCGCPINEHTKQEKKKK